MPASPRGSLLPGELYGTVEVPCMCSWRAAPRTAALGRKVTGRFTDPRTEQKTGAASRCQREAMPRTDWPSTQHRPLGSISQSGPETRANTVKVAGCICPRMQERLGGECWIAIVTFTTSRSTRVIQKYCTPPGSSLLPGNQTIAVHTGRVSLDSTSNGDIG